MTLQKIVRHSNNMKDRRIGKLISIKINVKESIGSDPLVETQCGAAIGTDVFHVLAR